ncbi:MAG TPA: hypothetical protein VMT35_17220, partial [Ignavibacteriaceae bacterium]|nr:hypothetical protein [Ignavibacteriaceae bacterium]
MDATFILFISFRSWLRYGRRPHYSELARFGKLIVVEEPLKILSKEFLINPFKSISQYFKFSKGIRSDYKYDIKIIRPILLFSSKLKNASEWLNLIDHLLLSLQFRKEKKSNTTFYLLTNKMQQWIVKKKRNSYYYLDIDDEWS